jgi:hypothetical protein
MKQNSNDDFIQVLLANSSRQNLPDSLKLFAPFVGSWEWSGFDYLEDGTKIPTRGKWIFEWVLNGNAIQDVFIFEDPHNKTNQLSFVEYGTTIRFPINDGKTWKAVWIGPMNRVVIVFDVKVIGTEIVLEGKNEKSNIVHWTFSEITESNFHWRGEYSSNGGESWILYEELDAKRKD